MKTITLQIEDSIFEKVIAFLKIFPENRLKVTSGLRQTPFVSEAEQRDLEELLGDPECFESEKNVTVEL